MVRSGSNTQNLSMSNNMKNEAAVALGKLSHSRQSEAQSQASRWNGKNGGRPRTTSPFLPARSVTQVDRAIKHLGVEIIRGRGYFYFVSLDPAIGQVGDSIYICYLNQQSLARWIKDAESAVKENNLKNK